MLTTGKCNLKCDYCGGSFPESLVPSTIKYGVIDLNNFLSCVENVTIAFYGGEPLINSSWIMKVMNRVEAKHYVIQTNGLLIDKLPMDYWLRMSAVLLSIDGVEETTDAHRGKGVYKAIIEAAKKLRSMCYEGDIIARMTLTESSDVYRDVLHLLSLEIFDHVHWQLNAVWNPNMIAFKRWATRDYIPKLKALVDLWTFRALKGEILGIAPFKALSYAMIKGLDLGSPPCGAGWASLAINTNGDVLACPIAVDVKWARLGNVRESSCNDLLGVVRIGEPCVSCNYNNLCGGRCLYAYYERLWGDEGFGLMCEVSRALIDKLRQVKPVIEKALKSNGANLESLRYPTFPNSIEIIP
ncbi:MAG: TIGR04084 family radical SAM/SPASM domain-containing protein [Candidatus Nezhaarchaeales archaeon]